MIVLDTSCLSMVFRRQSAAVPHRAVGFFRRLVQEDRALGIPGVVLQELLSGLKRASDFERLEDALSGFPLLLADRSAHRLAAEMRTACRQGGVSAAAFDCLIAAQTILTGGALFTLDRDFEHIASVTGLKVLKIPAAVTGDV